MSSTTTGNERILSQNTRVKSAGQNKKERPFIKTTAEKKIADDEFMAAAIGDVEWLRQSIRGNRGVINYDKNGLAPVHLAAIHGRLACLKLLIEKFKVDVNLPSQTGWRPLHLAISNQTGKRSFTCVQYLLSMGADPSSENDDGLMPMHQAASEGHVQCLKLLIDEGARIDGVDSRGHKPIDLAKLWGHRKCARILAAETWHREKDFVAQEMKQLDKVKMQQVLKEIEEDEELKASQQFYGQEAFNTWLRGKGLPSQDEPEEAAQIRPAPTKDTIYKPNSMVRQDTALTSPPATRQTLGRSLPPSRSRPMYEEDFYDEDIPIEEETPEKSQMEFNPAPLPPTFTNPRRWNKSTKVATPIHISKLPDHYPRDEYTMLPKYPPKRGGVLSPQAKQEELRSEEVDTNKPLRVPKLPAEVINKALSGDNMERPVVFKCRTILDGIQKRHPGEEKPRDEVGLHFGNDMSSFIFKSSMQSKRSGSRLTTLSSKSSTALTGGSGSSVKLDLGAVADIMKRMQKPASFPNLRGEEYDLNLGQLAGI